ncbi:MAG: LemA family protein [Fimbriimonadaceae bacterium]
MLRLAWILVLLLAAGLVAAIVVFNRLVRLRQMVRGAWSDVDVYLKRRAELIPNLVASVQAFAGHEQAVLTAVAEARAHALSVRGGMTDRANAESEVGQAVVRVIGLAEAYPELASSENFRRLQQELSDTEKAIANARQYYNACVRDYNTKIESFPSNLVASAAGFRSADFFEIEDASQRLAPRIGR